MIANIQLRRRALGALCGVIVAVVAAGPASAGTGACGVRFIAPAAASYTAASGDDGTLISAANATGPATGWAAASLPVNLPAMNAITAPWTLCGTTDANKAVVFDAPLMAAPTAPSLSAANGGTLVATTYFAKITYVNLAGETVASGESTLAVGANQLLVVASPAAPPAGSATGYNVYVSSASGTETKQNAAAIALGTNWTEPLGGLITGAAPPAIGTAPSAYILDGGQSLASYVLGTGNGQTGAVLADGTNYRVIWTSRESRRINGATATLPTRWIYPGGPGYQATQGDNGNEISSSLSSGLTVTLPSTTAIAAGWSVVLRAAGGQALTVIPNATSGGLLVLANGSSFSSAGGFSLPPPGVLLVQFDGANFLELGSGAPRHVATNAALQGLVGSAGAAAVRDGFYAAGDGGGNVAYYWSAAACAGGADNGARVAPTAGGGCWNAAIGFGQRVSPQVWGAKCDGVTNDTTAVQAALTWAATQANGGGHIVIPAAVCLVTPPLAITGTMKLTGVPGHGTTAGSSGSTLLETAGSTANLINVGYQTGQTNFVTIDGLQLAGNGPTAGYAISSHNVGNLTVRNIGLQSTWGGIDDEQSNSDLYDNIWGYTIGTNSQAFYWYANPATTRADQLTLRNVSINAQNFGNDGLVLDGFVQTLNAQNIIFLQTSHGLWIKNTAVSTSNFPAFASIYNLQVEGGKVSACEIDAGRYIYITDSFCSNYGGTFQGPGDGAVLTVKPDALGSVTSDLHFENMRIDNGSMQAALIQGQGIYFSNVTLGAAGLKTAGPAVEIAGAAGQGSADYGFSNVKFCGKFGDTVTGMTYGLQIDNYVGSVKVNGGNFNYCQTGAVDFTRETYAYQLYMTGSSDTNGNPLPMSAGDYQANKPASASACGTAPLPVVQGNNLLGSVTVGGGSPTTCTITFAGTGVHIPGGGGPLVALINSNNAAVPVDMINVTATGFQITTSAPSLGVATIIYWHVSQGVN